jgi:hypothetical protein
MICGTLFIFIGLFKKFSCGENALIFRPTQYLCSSLAWGEETNKRHISGWELIDTQANVTYFRNRSYNETRPETAEEASQTW